jgi:hypothetical protein
MSSPLDTVPRSVYARVMLVELPSSDAEAWREVLEGEDVVVLSVPRVIEAAAKISPELVHVVVTPESMSTAAHAVLVEAAAEVGAEVLAIPTGTDAEEAFGVIRAAVRRVKQRRGGT